MPMVEIYPMTFEPVFRDYIWGGRNLETLYDRGLPEGIVAESWDISAFPGSATRIESGYWKWRTLVDVVGDLGGHFLGTVVRERFGIKFPLLFKLLDAQQDLSVQVHPDDAYAAGNENGAWGKSEMWYILHAEPGAELICGLVPGTTHAGLEAALRGGSIESMLQRVKVQAGDVINIPAGTVHALLAGAVVAEIQQNSDTTFRLHDWGRVGVDGQPRPLQVATGCLVINLENPQAGKVSPLIVHDKGGVRIEMLVDSPLFTTERITLEPDAVYANHCDGTSFQVIGCITGEGKLTWSGAPLALRAIRFALLPAILGKYELKAAVASTWLRTYIH